MFYWKKINVDPAEIEKLKKLYLDAMPDNTDFFQTLDLGVNTFLGMEVQRFVLIQVEPYAQGRIHTDWRPKTYGYQLALQIPLINCENSVTSLWESKHIPPTQYTSNGQPYNYYPPDSCSKVAEFQLTCPIIFRTDIPHSVDNNSKFFRKAISVRFKNDPWHLVNE